MKIKSIVLALTLSVLAIAGIAAANTGLQNTPYSTNNFSATFNGPVTADAPTRNRDNNSTDYRYNSAVGGTYQSITVRFIDYPIPADLTSSDFYADHDGDGGTITDRSTSTYQGHSLTYARRRYTFDGKEYAKRTRYIIVSQREVIFITQIVPFEDFTAPGAGVGDQPQWFEFEDSLSIK